MGPIVPIISLGATLAGGVVSAMGASQQAQAQADAARYQAQVARNNQIMAQRNAEYERQRKEVDTFNQDLMNRDKQGKINAALAASGFAMDAGNSARIRGDAAMLGRQDTLTVAGNADRKAYNFDVEASNQEASAGMYDMQASNAEKAGNLAVFSSLLGSASSFGDKWMSYSKAGAFG